MLWAWFGHVLGMSWACVGGVLGMFWGCFGHVLGVFWSCFGGVLGMFCSIVFVFFSLTTNFGNFGLVFFLRKVEGR